MPCHNSRIPWGYKLGTDLQLLLGIRVCALRAALGQAQAAAAQPCDLMHLLPPQASEPPECCLPAGAVGLSAVVQALATPAQQLAKRPTKA